MPSILELAAYRFGVYLTQCRELHRKCTSSSDAGLDDVAVLQDRLDLLRDTFAQIAATTRLDASLTRAGHALIRNCTQLWKQWASWPSQDWLQKDQIIESSYADNLDRLEIVANEAIKSEAHVVPWLELGKEIADGEWQTFWSRPEPVPLLVRSPKKKKKTTKPAGHQHKKPKWLWNDEKALKSLLKKTGQPLDQIFPTLPDENDLPDTSLYGVAKYRPWTRIEAGILSLSSCIECPQSHCEGIAGPDAAISATSGPVQEVDKKEIERLIAIKKRIDPEDAYIGQSLPILRMFAEIDLANKPSSETGKPETPVLLLGETGAGKTVVANLIHEDSERPGSLGIEHATSVAGADHSIIRQHWVGYGKNSLVQGADPKGGTGTIQQHDGGSIFLDEVPDTPEWFQTFLLQVLDRQPIQLPHGEGDPIVPNVRMIFATHKTLDDLHAQKQLRNDLLDRIRRWVIQVPPLRSRKEDIVCFVDRYCKGCRMDYRFLLALVRYDWPGNVRELIQVLDIATRKRGASSEKLTVDHLRIENPAIIKEVRETSELDAERQVLEFLVHTFTGQGLRKGKGLQKRIGDFLKVHESTISKRLKELEIDSTK